MKVASVSTRGRSGSMRREVHHMGIAAVLAGLFGVLSIADPASGSGQFAASRVAPPPLCAHSAVAESASTNLQSYGPGSNVEMMSSIHNISATECSILIGAISPSFTVTTPRGAEVWNNCDVSDQPGACPLYLMKRTLKPGATYSKVAGWDQRLGKPPVRAPMGVYQLTIQFDGIVGKALAKFTLAADDSPSTVTVTQKDSGRQYRLHVGDRLVVTLSARSSYRWTEPASSNKTALLLIMGTSGSTATATFSAEAVGGAAVTAVDNPDCYPQCLAPSLLFHVSVSVVN